MNPIVVREIVGTNAISMSSGRKLKDEIEKEWDRSSRIVIDFSGIDVFASPFFNASIGVLLKDNTIEKLQEKLEFKELSDHGRRLLNLVIGNAIKFYSDEENKTELGLDEIRKDI